MNELVQLESGLVGNTQSVDALARAKTASILILSDTHGHYPLFQRIVLKYGPSADALLFAGDGMWDVVRYLENAHEDEQYRAALPPVLAFVAGNGDGDRYRVCPGGQEGRMSCDLPGTDGEQGTPLAVPHTQTVTACGHRIFICHGNRYSVDVSTEVLVNVAKAADCGIAVFGHTHMPHMDTVSHVLVVNPGSPARPRGYSAPGFALLQLESGKNLPIVQFMKI